MKTFTEKVRDVVKKIPKGSVLTYRQVAARAGSHGASRAVGSIMAQNFDPDIRFTGSSGPTALSVTITVGEAGRKENY